ncbi:MAG: hydrogenase iron-sulfur subunit [Synergistaceae bacterium]|nr:hydrogenase iron-sulfur subunit [Synergistaceae bacterium]
MKALIAGKNEINKKVSAFLADNGFEVLLAEDVDNLRYFEGEAGDFSLELAGEKTRVDFVILTELPARLPLPVGGGRVLSLYETDKTNLTTRRERDVSVVFLMDYFCESQMSATLRALEDSIRLARSKRRVYCLSRFVRTSGYGAENLYKEARNEGVEFIKYESLDIVFRDGRFVIKACDGAMTFDISATEIFADGTRDVGDSFRLAAKKLNLRPDSNGYLLEDRHFLAPVRTSRRGVYHISRDVAADDLKSALMYIAGQVRARRSENGRDVAVVDGDKCVLCCTCFRSCPHAAMRPDSDERIMRNLAEACEGCGICESLCPGGAITLGGKKEKKSGERPDSGSPANGRGTLVFCCENSAAAAIDEALTMLGERASGIDVRVVPCGGGISMEEMGETLCSYSRVMAAVCIEGSCRHLDGGRRACLQAGRLSALLERAELSGSRVACVEVSHAMPGMFADALADFADSIQEP